MFTTRYLPKLSSPPSPSAAPSDAVTFPCPHPFPRPPPPPRVPFVSPYPTPTPPPRAQSLSAPPPSIFGPCRRRLPSGPGNLMPVTVGSCSRFGREKRQPGQERQVLAAPLSRWLCPAGSDRHACVGQTPKPRVVGGPSAGPASPQEGGGVRGWEGRDRAPRQHPRNPWLCSSVLGFCCCFKAGTGSWLSPGL